MLRILLGLTLLIAFTLFVRHQYRMAMQNVITPATNPLFPAAGNKVSPESHRRKCLICGGTGKAPSFNFTSPNNRGQTTQPCPTCNGTGWVDDPFAVPDKK